MPPTPPCAGDFLRQDNPVYEDLTKFPEVKKLMEEQLEDYNMEPGIIPMGLVLFKDAIEHGMQRRTVVCPPQCDSMAMSGLHGRKVLVGTWRTNCITIPHNSI